MDKKMKSEQEIFDFVKDCMKPKPEDRISEDDLGEALFSRVSVLALEYDLTVDLVGLYGGCHPEDEEHLLSVIAEEYGLEYSPEASHGH
jgi:hypothetical protein